MADVETTSELNQESNHEISAVTHNIPDTKNTSVVNKKMFSHKISVVTHNIMNVENNLELNQETFSHEKSTETSNKSILHIPEKKLISSNETILKNSQNQKTWVNVKKNVESKKMKSHGSIKIYSASKQEGKRIRNKTHSCYFCGKLIINMARHFELIHNKEIEVARCLVYPKQSKERKKGFAEIIKVGDFYHNCNVMSTKIGELILIRRPTENEIKFVNENDYGPCPNCLGFLLKKHIWHHMKYNCEDKQLSPDKVSNSRHVVAESNAIMADIYGQEFTRDFQNTIVSALKIDEIGQVCYSDILILKFGSMQFEKFGKTQNELIRQTMRQLARLVIALRELCNGISHTLGDFLTPEKFDLVVQATKNISMTDHVDDYSRPNFHTPSLALKLGYSLKKCVSIQRGNALRSGNLQREKKLKAFLKLMEMEWHIRISSNALSTLHRRKINAVDLLPVTKDLCSLSKFLDDEIAFTKAQFLKGPINNTLWSRLATLALARIILFNKRRSGEAARMKMSDYISRPSWQEQTTEELKLSLSPVEQKLAESLTLVEIEGKRGRKVPVILTQPIKESIDLLIRHRYECNISCNNTHVFARSNNSKSFLRGHDCLKKICDELNLENPGLITGTKLRKYVATVCQLFNMTENEYDWLARHLGHDIRVHREFYRMHENAIELTKISRILLAVDNGEANRFAGKNIEDIQVRGECSNLINFYEQSMIQTS